MRSAQQDLNSLHVLELAMRRMLAIASKEATKVLQRLPNISKEQYVNFQGKCKKLTSYMEVNQINEAKLLEFCNLSSEEIHQLTAAQAADYFGYISTLNETNFIVLDFFKSIDTKKTSDEDALRFIENHASGNVINKMQKFHEQLKSLQASLAQFGIPGQPEKPDDDLPDLFLLQNYAKFYLNTRELNKKLEANKELLLEHTVNLLDVYGCSLSDNSFDWGDPNTLFAKRVNPLEDCLASLAQACKTSQKGDEILESISKQDYSQAFRKACAYGAAKVIHIFLEHKSLLNNFDINEPSSNGNTALDWINKAPGMNMEIKKSLVNELLRSGALTGQQLKLNSKQQAK